MDALLQDLRYLCRTLPRMRGTAVAAVLTLALGIAASSTMASVVYAAVFRPLPFVHPERLVLLNTVRTAARTGTRLLRWSYPETRWLRESVHSFEAVGAYSVASTLSVGGRDGAEQIDGELVTAAYLRILSPALAGGRMLVPDEESPGVPVAIVSATLWRRQFGDASFSEGRTIDVSAVPLTIVGVFADGFNGLSGRAQLWIPVGMAPTLTYRDYLTTPQHFISVIGRLGPDVSLEQANAELAIVGPQLPVVPEGDEEPASWSAAARPLGAARVDPAQRRSSLLLLAAVVCMLLIACSNVATLLLMRARLRQREIAVRLAIGAPRGRIVRQLLTEAAVLAAAGGAVGVLLAAWSIDSIPRVWPTLMPPPHTGYVQIGSFAAPSLDAVTLLTSVGLTAICTLLCGLAPALHAVHRDPARSLTESNRSTPSLRHGRSLRTLAAVQVSLAVLLTAGALLLVASFLRLSQTRTGFDPQRVMTFWVSPPNSLYAPEDGPAIVESVLHSVERVPGVASATVNRCAPFSQSCSNTTVFFPERPTAPAAAPLVGRHYVSADYFRTLGIRLLRGRVLADSDRLGRAPVTVINEEAARRFWPGEDPIGKRVWFGSGTGFTDPRQTVEVVGVVADVKYWPLTERPGPDFYTSYLQFTYPDTMVIVKARAGDPAVLMPSLRAAIAAVDPALPVWDARPLGARTADALDRPRFNASMTAAFAAAAALLAALGIFGVISSGVGARTRELAIRLALGSTPRGLHRLVLREALALSASGAAIGLGGSWMLLRLLRTFLFDITPGDPYVLGAAVLAMIGVSLAAALLPAHRAALADPMVAFRAE